MLVVARLLGLKHAESCIYESGACACIIWNRSKSLFRLVPGRNAALHRVFDGSSIRDHR